MPSDKRTRKHKIVKAKIFTGLNSRRRVTFGRNDHENNLCQKLIDHGFQLNTIAHVTGLSVGQISYRSQMLGLKVTDFRKGTSPRALNIIAKLDTHGVRTFSKGLAS